MRSPALLIMLLFPGCVSAAASAQHTIRGTVHAPPGADISGAVVVACRAESGRCRYTDPHPASKAVRIDSRGASARYVIDGLEPGHYVVLGTHDINGNGAEDAGDHIGEHGSSRQPRLVRPPADRIDLWLAEMRPAEDASSDPPQAPGNGGVEGIFIGITRQPVAPGGDYVASGITWTPVQDWMTFFADGRVFLGLPPSGLAQPFDWRGECAPRPSWCATYTATNAGVTIRWPDGETRALQWHDGALRTEERAAYARLASMDGRRIEGHFAVPWKEQYAPTRIHLTRDGRFTEENLLDGVDWRGADADAAMVPRGSGTYRITANTLLLRYRDGRTASLVIYATDAELAKADPDEIHINAHNFRRLR